MALKSFVEGCKDFAGVTFSGFFTMPPDHFEHLYKHFQETGVNLLDDYCNCIYLQWDVADESKTMDAKEFNDSLDSVSRIRKLRIIPPNDIHDAIRSARSQYKRHLEYQQLLDNEPRRKAQSFIGRRKIREYIFKRDGHSCLSCSTEENLSIDHIEAINKGGQNKLSNLQTLCRSCNSKKNDSYIDYR